MCSNIYDEGQPLKLVDSSETQKYKYFEKDALFSSSNKKIHSSNINKGYNMAKKIFLVEKTFKPATVSSNIVSKFPIQVTVARTSLF